MSLDQITASNTKQWQSSGYTPHTKCDTVTCQSEKYMGLVHCTHQRTSDHVLVQWDTHGIVVQSCIHTVKCLHNVPCDTILNAVLIHTHCYNNLTSCLYNYVQVSSHRLNSLFKLAYKYTNSQLGQVPNLNKPAKLQQHNFCC